jgi:hypothetical protein
MYRTICTQLWTDPKVRGLSRDGRLLFVYLITNPHTHLCGLYYLPQEIVKKETGIPDTLCHTLYDTLSSLELALWDRDTETIFVLNMFRYQGRGEKNERSAATHLLSLHHCSLIGLFFQRYPAVLTYWKGYPIDTLSDTPSELRPPVPDPVSSLPSGSETNLKSKSHSKKSNGKREICDADGPTEKHRELARVLKVELGPEWGKFKNYCLAHGKRYANFEAAFRNWLANANDMKGSRHALH